MTHEYFYGNIMSEANGNELSVNGSSGNSYIFKTNAAHKSQYVS